LNYARNLIVETFCLQPWWTRSTRRPLAEAAIIIRQRSRQRLWRTNIFRAQTTATICCPSHRWPTSTL